MPSGWPSYPPTPSNRLLLQKVTRRGWRSYTTLQQVKKGGDEVIPSLPWTSFKGIQNLGPYFAHLRKRKKADHTKMIFWEKSLSVFENWRSYPNWRVYISLGDNPHLNGIPNGGATAAQPLVIVTMMMMMGVGVKTGIGTVRIVDDDHLLRFRNRCGAAMAMTDNM